MTTTPTPFIATIPFSGFYEAHDTEIENLLATQVFSDDHGKYIPECQKMIDRELNWGEMFTAYAAEYTKSMAHEIGLGTTITFHELQSPREYNFHTDLIAVSLDDAAQAQLRAYHAAKSEYMREYVKDRCTSRSGFSSHYANDIEHPKWQDFDQLDTPQVDLLMWAMCHELAAENWSISGDPHRWTFWMECEFMEEVGYRCVEAEVYRQLPQIDAVYTAARAEEL